MKAESFSYRYNSLFVNTVPKFQP